MAGDPDLRRIVDESLCQPEGERGDAVDDDEGVPDDRRLDRGGAAGDDAGASVVEGLAGVGDEVEIEELQGRGDVSRPPFFVAGDKFPKLLAVDGGGHRQNIVATER